MNLKVGAAFIMWWILLGLFYQFGAGYLSDSSTTAPNIIPNWTNYSNYSAPASEGVDIEITGSSRNFLQVAGFLAFGIGLPTGTPAWFQIIFSSIITGVNIFAILFIVEVLHP